VDTSSEAASYICGVTVPVELQQHPYAVNHEYLHALSGCTAGTRLWQAAPAQRSRKELLQGSQNLWCRLVGDQDHAETALQLWWEPADSLSDDTVVRLPGTAGNQAEEPGVKPGQAERVRSRAGGNRPNAVIAGVWDQLNGELGHELPEGHDILRSDGGKYGEGAHHTAQDRPSPREVPKWALRECCCDEDSGNTAALQSLKVSGPELVAHEDGNLWVEELQECFHCRRGIWWEQQDVVRQWRLAVSFPARWGEESQDHA
jgi:hypothetical protein